MYLYSKLPKSDVVFHIVYQNILENKNNYEFSLIAFKY